MSEVNGCAMHRWAPVFEAWDEKDEFDYRSKDFVEVAPLFFEKEDALRYSAANTGNYPYCTTGRIVRVEIVVQPIPEP